MNVSLNWLTDYVDVSMPLAELEQLLKQIGLPVEGIVETDTDIVLDLEVTSNRGDCLGHLGVARELAAATGLEFKPPAVGELPTSGRAEELTSVEVLAPDLCPRYTARVIRGVKVGPSPRWMVERLEAVGLRSINNIVDVTNYVMFEYSQPLHSFDHDKLGERRIVVRRAVGGEHMVSIDQTKCELDETMLIIADAARPVAIAGVMGGLDTEVTDATANVLIESAEFDPLSIRKTSRKLALMSESNYRFERGVDPVGVDAASLRACRLITELAGGQVAEGLVDVWAAPFEPARVSLRFARCSALLGLDVAPERQMEILGRLGLAPRRDGERAVCTIPSYRRDLRREVDLIEEVARMEGYDEIPVADRVAHAVCAESPATRIRRRTGQLLAACGFDEAITFTFVDDAEADLAAPGRHVAVDKLTRKTNNVLRPTLLPSLLRACKANQDAGTSEVSLFEIAACFPPGEGHLPDEYVELALVTSRDLAELRGAVETVAAHVAPAAELTVRPAAAPHLADGSGAEIDLDGEMIGTIGVVSPKLQHHYGLERAPAAAAVRFEPLVQKATLTRTYRPLAKFPAVRRDLSIIVDEPTAWGQLAETIAGVDQPLRRGVEYVTTFRGEPIPAGRKSVTVRLVYRCDDRTLRGEEVDEQVAAVTAALKDALAAELRA